MKLRAERAKGVAEPAGAAAGDGVRALGSDFGGTSIKLAVCEGGRVVERLEAEPTPRDGDVGALVGRLVGRVGEVRQAHPGLAAVGCGVPGLVDFDRGLVHELSNVEGWRGVPLRALLEEGSGLPVVVENDAAAMCYAEWRHGAGRGFSDLVALTLGTGVGGGLVLGGRPYRGRGFMAGEVGQMSVRQGGVAGHYGNCGALERYVGNRQIAELARGRYAAAGLGRGMEDCEPHLLAERAEDGDEVALGVWDEVAGWLAVAVANIVWLLDPEAVVIGGGVARAGRLLFERLEGRVAERISPVQAERLAILPAEFGVDAGVVGSAALAAAAAVRGEGS
jgi:glucokinase